MQQQLKGNASATVKNSAATLNAGVNSHDNTATQVVTRKLRKRANAEAAAMGVISSSLTGISGLDSSSMLNGNLALLGEQKLAESSSVAGHLNSSNTEPLDSISSERGPLLGEEEGPMGDYGEMPPRIKGSGNSIAITGNGYRVDSLLAKLEIKLSDEQIMNDLLIITQGKYKSSSTASSGSSNQTQTCSSGKLTSSGSSLSNSGSTPATLGFDTTPSGSGGSGTQSKNAGPVGSLKSGAPFSVYIEDKNLVYNSMTFCKGQQVYIEGQMRGNFTILTINHTEIQLRKLHDSTKIKISLDMLRRGAYKLVLR